jgi:hypothetical protein
VNAPQRIRARYRPARFLVRGDKVIDIQGKDGRHAQQLPRLLPRREM